VDLVVAGERLQIVTNAGDQLNAERGIGHTPMDSPVELGLRVWWCALRRTFPDTPAAKSFRTFVEDLERADEEDDEADFDSDMGPMDPTRPAASDG
jgi:hypothetical protein